MKEGEKPELTIAPKVAKEATELAELEREMGFLQGQDQELNEIAGKMGLDYSSSLQSSNIKLIADIIRDQYIDKNVEIPEKVFEEVDKAYGAAKKEKELHISRDQFKSALGLLVAEQLGLIGAIEGSDKPAAEKAKEKEAATTQAKQLIKVYIQAIKEGRTSYIGDALLLMREYGLEQEFRDILDGAVKEANNKEAAERSEIQKIPDNFGGIPLLKLIEVEEENIKKRNELILKQEKELESIKKDSETVERANVNSPEFKEAFKRMMADKRDPSYVFQFIQTAKEIEESLNKSKLFTESVLPHASPKLQESHSMLQKQIEVAQVDQQIKSRVIKRIIFGFATEKIGKKNDENISIEEMQEAQRRQKELSSDPIFSQAVDQILTPEVIKKMKEATSQEECDRAYNSLIDPIKERVSQIKRQSSEIAQVDVKDSQRQLDTLSLAITEPRAASPQASVKAGSRAVVGEGENALSKASRKQGSNAENIGKKKESRFTRITNIGKNVILRPIGGVLGAAFGCLKGAYQGVRDGDGFIDSCGGLVSGAMKGTIQGARDGFCFDVNGIASGNYASGPLRRGDYDKDADRGNQDKENSKNGTKWGLLIGLLILIALPGPIGLLALVACVVAGNRLGQGKGDVEKVVHVGKRSVRTSSSGEELERPREPSKEELESMVTTVREIEQDKQTKGEIRKTAEKLVEKAIENPEEFSKIFKKETEELAERIKERRAQEASKKGDGKAVEKEDGKGIEEKAKEAAKEAVKPSAGLAGPAEEAPVLATPTPTPASGPSGIGSARKKDNKGKLAGPHSERVVLEKESGEELIR